MTLAEATAGFLKSILTSSASLTTHSVTHEESVRLLIQYFSPESQIDDLTASRLRDFLARWYLEKFCTLMLSSSDSPERNAPAVLHSVNSLPEPRVLLDSMATFFKWADQYIDEQPCDCLTDRSSQVLAELRETLPRAIEITGLLSEWIRERRGAFAFPEFLTSFEEGGRSEYDIDTPGSIGALESYFQIIRTEGSLIEARDLISEESVWPIIFPCEIAVMLDRSYVINLELVRTASGWEIVDCGFAYPPGTEV